MAGKATSVYVSIVESITHKMIENKKFFNSGEANTWMKTMLENYPKPKYYMVKETY